MKKYNWAISIFISLVLFLAYIFFTGAKDWNEVVTRIDTYIKINSDARNITFSLFFGAYVGLIFWMIKLYSVQKEDSDARWMSKSVLALLSVLAVVYLTAVFLEAYVTSQFSLWPF